jgi:hypothetical protein
LLATERSGGTVRTVTTGIALPKEKPKPSPRLTGELRTAHRGGKADATIGGVPSITCPVCGSEELAVQPYATWPPPAGLRLLPPYEELLGRPSYEVCPNCGFEFGNDDNPGTAEPLSFEAYRAEWEAGGRRRFDG